MKKDIRIYYDEEGDFFELYLGKPKEGYYEDIADGILKRIDEKTGEVIGIAIHGFRKRAKNLKEIILPIPFKMEILAK